MVAITQIQVAVHTGDKSNAGTNGTVYLGSAVAWLGVQLHRLSAGWMARRRAARELEALFYLTNYELRALGISRSDFSAIMQGTHHRD